MKIAICDDEREIRNHMERSIHLLYPQVKVLQFADGEALLACGEQIDILFLDIQMDKLSGIEAARRLREAGSHVTIIFVTAIEEYVFQAFDVKAFHYLVKPVDQVKFFAVLREAIGEQKRVRAAQQTEQESIAVKKGTVTRRVYLHEILYLEVYNRKITLHTAEEDIEFYGKLKELEESLGNDFMRCHRAYIVNLRYVMKYDAGRITLDNGAEILLAQQKYADFVRRYMCWLKRTQRADNRIDDRIDDRIDNQTDNQTDS